MADPRYYNLQLVYQLADAGPGDDEDPPLDDPDGRDDPRPEELNGDWLRLSQTPFAEPPAGGFDKWLQDSGKELNIANYTEYFDKYKSHCKEGGDLQVTIEVHRSRQALAYKLVASYGALSRQATVESREVIESHNMEAGTELDLQTHVDGEIETTWEGEVYDSNGEQLDKPPTLAQDGQKLTAPSKITGTLRTKYREVYDAWTLTITPRAAADSDPNNRASAYESTVMAFWGRGNVESLQVSLPDMGGDCADNDNDSDDEDDDEDADGDCYDLYIKYHQCTGKEISRRLVRVRCPEVVKADCEKKCRDGEESKVEDCLKNCQ